MYWEFHIVPDTIEKRFAAREDTTETGREARAKINKCTDILEILASGSESETNHGSLVVPSTSEQAELRCSEEERRREREEEAERQELTSLGISIQYLFLA